MTLHWWMHWFWVTTLLILFGSSGKTLAAPQSEELQHMNTDLEISTQRHPERQGRAMYYTKPPHFTSNNTKIPLTNNSTETNLTINKEIIKNTNKDIKTNITTKNATLEIVHPSLQATHTNSTESSNLTKIDEEETMNLDDDDDIITTLLPPVYTNITEQNSTLTNKKRNLTRVDVVKDEGHSEGIAESKIVTDKPLSLEIQTRIPPNIESSRRVIDFSDGGMDTGAIAGVSFAALVLAALAGSTAFVLYRRRYLNKPQTLNDKCSNPDSSGYLDDSTIRDNSEEMYSLDNDSFLNSLEAMTIQNYWTDTVKHTKL